MVVYADTYGYQPRGGYLAVSAHNADSGRPSHGLVGGTPPTRFRSYGRGAPGTDPVLCGRSRRWRHRSWPASRQVRPGAQAVSRENRGSLSGLTDPQLVYEHGEVGVELVVADAFGQHDEGARVVDRYPGSLVDDLLIDVRPESPGGIRSTVLERQGLRDLGVDPLVAELGGIEVPARTAGEEGPAGQQRPDEV